MAYRYPLELRVMAAQLAGGVSHIAGKDSNDLLLIDEAWFHRDYGFVTGMAAGLQTAFGLDVTTLILLQKDLWQAILYKDWPRAIKLFQAIRLWADAVANETIHPEVLK